MNKYVMDSDEMAEVSLWRAPEVGEANHSMKPLQREKETKNSPDDGHVEDQYLKPITADQLSALEEAARESGFQHGYAEGLEKASDEINQKIQNLDSLLKCLTHPFDEVSDKVRTQLLNLVKLIVEIILRKEIERDSEIIIRVIKDAITKLSSKANTIKIYLHPDDMKIVQEVFPSYQSDRGWELHEDQTISKGGCRLSTEFGEMDATIENRLQKLLASIDPSFNAEG